MSPTKARDEVCRVARTDNTAALELARQIESPWFGCQALAYVARYAPNEHVVEYAEEALRVGRRNDDLFGVVGSSAWVVRALIERNATDLLDKVLAELVETTNQIENMASRSEAVFSLFQSAFPIDSERWKMLFEALMRATEPMLHWRQARNLRDAFLMIAKVDRRFVDEYIHRVGDEKTRRKIQDRIASGERLLPRGFFQ